MPDDFDRRDYRTPRQIADMLGISADAVRKQIAAGTLPALRTPSGRYLIHRDAIALRPTGEPGNR